MNKELNLDCIHHQDNAKIKNEHDSFSLILAASSMKLLYSVPQRKDSVQNNSKDILFSILLSQLFKTEGESWKNKSKYFQKTLVSSKDCRFYYLEKGTKSKIDVLKQHECVTHKCCLIFWNKRGGRIQKIQRH